jgi:hypothetical protein
MNHVIKPTSVWRVLALTTALFSASHAGAHDLERSVLVITSSNGTATNDVVVFKLEHAATPTLSLSQTLPTGGVGGASGNAGIVQFENDLGAVANFGSNSVSRLARHGDWLALDGQIALDPGCVQPDSVALRQNHLFVVGTNCAESHTWPWGSPDGAAVTLSDPSAAQIAVGHTWAAVTLKSGSVLQLPLNAGGALEGNALTVTLPANANNTPLGEAFWHDTLGVDPAHSPDSFALITADRHVFPVEGPAPAFPSNAPCWLAKGPGNVWYAGNSPGEAISIFFSDGAGGVFYKSVPLPGVATDVTVSHDGRWFAVIFTANGSGYVSLFSIDQYGDLTLVATSPAVGVAAFSGVAISN